MRSLKLPGLTELATTAGTRKLYHIDPDELGRYVVNLSDLTMIRGKIEGLLGNEAGEVLISVKTDISNMKSNSLAQQEATNIVTALLKQVSSELPSLIRDVLGETAIRMAPSLPAHFKLFLPESTPAVKSPAMQQLFEALHRLAPIYKKLEGAAKAELLLKEKSAGVQVKLAECESNLRFI